MMDWMIIFLAAISFVVGVVAGGTVTYAIVTWTLEHKAAADGAERGGR